MNSMTGYGCGQTAKSGIRVSVDVSSLNRKQSEIMIALPRELEALEPDLRAMVVPLISRGRLSIRVTLQVEEGEPTMRFNESVAAEYLKQIRKFAKTMGISGDVGVDKLLEIPGVMENRLCGMEPETVLPLVKTALKKAMDGLLAMRKREGTALAKDLKLRIGGLEKLLSEIDALSAGLPAKYKELLVKRIEKNGFKEFVTDESRLMQEVAFAADRCDITEEITRLRSHFGQFKDAMKSKQPVGRMLDFLAQEMGREINTIGSKANDAAIAALVVEFKAELEKYREQVQNVE